MLFPHKLVLADVGPYSPTVVKNMLIADLLKSMKDVNFSQLVTEYGSMAGINDKSITPNINALMAERERVPATPLKQAQTPTPPPTQPTAPPPVVDEIAEPINVPTPLLIQLYL